MILLPRGTGMQILRKYQSSFDDPKKSEADVIYYYNCGEPSLRISIDDLFEGTKEINLTLTDRNEGELNGLFETSQPLFKQLGMPINVKGCKQKSVVENKLNTKTPKVLQCLEIGGE